MTPRFTATRLENGAIKITDNSRYMKKALKREEGYPLGIPAPMYLDCVCGTKIYVTDGEDRFACLNCGTVYDGRGWIIDRKAS